MKPAKNPAVFVFGSVIIGQSSGRFFEPDPGRTGLMGASGT
jgi:hypothetical protein